MDKRKTITLPVNRVEGDLEVRLEVEDGKVVDAFSMGIMYRGIEGLMTGRGALDGLVITPRVCGICSTSHLYAAARALDMICGVEVPVRAERVRKAALEVEAFQNDMRQTFLLFAPDFVQTAYSGHPLHREAVSRYAPLRGSTAVEAVRETARILEIIAILGGQWPHSSFMVPGGVAPVISPNDIAQCSYLLNGFRDWYEKRVIGCPLGRWEDVAGLDDLESWLTETVDQRESELGFFLRFMKEAGVESVGNGCGNYISCAPSGGLARAADAGEAATADGTTGRYLGEEDARPFDQADIAEDVSHSRFKGIGSKHPFEGKTLPLRKGVGGDRYSWAKAPRYAGRPAETGPLAEMMTSGHPLYRELVDRYGPSAFVRQLARITRPARRIPEMSRCLEEIASLRSGFYRQHPVKVPDGAGFGIIEAPRGVLGHWVKIRGNAIDNYQIITPTSWNASPRDTNGRPGPLEAALIGVPVEDVRRPMAVHHVIHSFDPCMVCTVHTVDTAERCGTDDE